MNIEIFQVSDLKSLMLFLDENITENYDERVFLTIHQRWPEGFLIVKDHGNIIGVGCGAILPNEKLRILILALEKKFQGQGLGKELMRRLTEASKVYGIRKVTLEVRKDSDAINFYRKLNFSGVDVLPCYYQDGCDGIVMERQLSNQNNIQK